MIKPLFENKKILKLSTFDCGNELLNAYLLKYAVQDDKRNVSRTYVYVEDKIIVGFVTLCAAQIELEEMPNDFSKLPKYPIPAIKIARLAIDKNYQKSGYGKELLRFALIRVASISKEIGIKVIVVDAKEEAKTFYEHYGFVPLKTRKNTYVLPIEQILSAL